MQFEGFLRSLQGDFWLVLLILFTVFVLRWLILAALKEAPGFDDEEALSGARRLAGGVTKIVVVLVLLVFVGRALSVGFTNRMPRQDVDRTGVYGQMNH